jgi:hypothetical protein
MPFPRNDSDTCYTRKSARVAEAEAELPPFPARKAQMSPRINRPQRIRIVSKQRHHENDGSGCGPPRRHEDPEHVLRTRERNQQKGVGREVANHEGEQDESADETDVAPQQRQVPTRGQALREFDREVRLAIDDDRFGISAVG